MNLCPSCGIDHDMCRQIIADHRSSGRISDENMDLLRIVTSNCKTCREVLMKEGSGSGTDKKAETKEIQTVA